MNNHILIVDDTPANLRVLTSFLANAGYRISVALNGPDALKLCSQNPPDIILLDMMMPMMNGMETCQQLRKSNLTKDTPVIFITASNSLEDKLKAFEAGANDYVTKPMAKEEVLARISMHLTLITQKKALEGTVAQCNLGRRVAAHDLRNPLSIVAGYAQLGKSVTQSQEDRDFYQNILVAAKRMERIIGEFLAFEATRSNAPLHPFNLHEVLGEIQNETHQTAIQKQVSLSYTNTESLPVIGNRDFTYQILGNFVSNAIKYSPPSTRIELSAARLSGRIRACVQDQGPGVAPQERHHLFKEFGKTSNRPTGGESSTGLGLAITRALAECQNGIVGADFPEAGGSIFWLDLPAGGESSPQ